MAKNNDKGRKVKITVKMKKKLTVFFGLIIIALVVLIIRIAYINQVQGEEYKQKVLAQQEYASFTIPYKRGSILDCNGTVLAVSEDVYNVVLDCYIVNSDKKFHDPTVSAITENIPDITAESIESALSKNPESRYCILAEKLTYAQVSGLEDEINKSDKLNGVWLEKEYKRSYPYKTLASSLIGFTSAGNVGNGGIEGEYSNVLNGENGREYGYINTENNAERTVVEATDGNSVVSTIDSNIQGIVEKYIKQFNDEHTNLYTEGPGSANTGVIVMDPKSGEVLAMSDYPNFDLNNPYDLSFLYTQDKIDEMDANNTKLDKLNSIWNNYCITATFEPGSTTKLFTVAAGLETGALTGNETYVCNGYQIVGGSTIHCVNRNGHGLETIEMAISNSCNVALMQMASTIGVETFSKYQGIFNFGLKTTIDLPGEASTKDLIYKADEMRSIDLATNSFGQSFNTTMIQIASAYCSIINGGDYYRPHVVKKIVDSKGATVQTMQPTVLKQTVSEETCKKLMSYMHTTVATGTAKAAKVDGYSMGGKTGTAEKLPRKEGRYVVSFAGYAPSKDPKVLVYVVIDEPNFERQDQSAKFSSVIAKNILSEVLPYMGISPDEPLVNPVDTSAADAAAQQAAAQQAAAQQAAAQEAAAATAAQNAANNSSIDEVTGLPLDPNTGETLDRNTSVFD